MSKYELLFFLILSGVGFLLILCLIKYSLDYSSHIRYVKMELHRATSSRSRKHWKKELSALRWSILPGLTPERVKAIRRFFNGGKHSKKPEPQEDVIKALLLPSFLGIGLCAICLAGSTFAWFTGTQSSGTSVILAADYNVSVTVLRKAGGSALSPDGDRYVLSQGVYTVTLTATGTAETGYCSVDLTTTVAGRSVTLPSKDIHTAPIKPGESLSFVLDITQPVTVKITPRWGISSRDKDDKIYGGETYLHGQGTAPAVPAATPEVTPTPTPAVTSVPMETPPTAQPTASPLEEPSSEETPLPIGEEVTSPPVTDPLVDSSL